MEWPKKPHCDSGCKPGKTISLSEGVSCCSVLEEKPENDSPLVGVNLQEEMQKGCVVMFHGVTDKGRPKKKEGMNIKFTYNNEAPDGDKEALGETKKQFTQGWCFSFCFGHDSVKYNILWFAGTVPV